MAKADQTGPAAQPEHLLEQPGQHLQVALAEIADRAEIRPVQGGHCLKVEPLLAAPRDLARGVDAAAIGVEQQRHHHPRMIGRRSALLAIAGHDRRQVEPVAHHLAHKMRQMAGRHKILHRRRRQPNLIYIPRTKRLAHTISCSRHVHPLPARITRTGS